MIIFGKKMQDYFTGSINNKIGGHLNILNQVTTSEWSCAYAT